LYSIAAAEMIPDSRRPAGSQADIQVGFFENEKADWYFDVAEIDRGAGSLVQLALKNPNVVTEFLHAWKLDESRFEKFCLKAVSHFSLPDLSDEALLALWKKYQQLGNKRFSSSAIIDYFALGTDRLIADKIRDEVGETDSETIFAQIFSALTAPVYQSFINEAEIDLLKIAAGDSTETVEQYQQRYFWTKNNYATATDLPVSHFAEEIKVWKQSANDLKHHYERLVLLPEQNRRTKHDLIEKYDLSPHLRTLISMTEDFTWWQDERKKATMLNIHVGMFLLTEISKRISIDCDLLLYALAPEISALIGGNGPTANDLAERRRGSVYLFTPEHSVVLTGAEVVAEVKKIMTPDPAYDVPGDIRGLIANTGKVRGTAKVLSSVDQISKIKDGDVLVAVMTRPDYVPAMKRASAIVTDEGGITSHAAVVSRELGIPCIIGTKFATTVFSDGDTIEVNANHGWVRKIA